MAPFKSKRQKAKFEELVKKGEMTQMTFNEWLKDTPQDLPEKVEKGPINSLKKLRAVAKAKIK